ncbi:MAG: DNA translocase FtsK [Anaerovorax sp.]
MAEEKKKPGRPAGSKNKSNSKSKIASKEKEKQEYLKKVTGSRLRDEIWSIIMVAFGIFLAISVQTEAAGQLGLFIKEVLLGSFGAIAYILPYYLLLYGVLLFAKKTAHITARSASFLVLIFLFLTILNSARFLGEGTHYAFSLKFMLEMFRTGVLLKSGGIFGMTVGLLLIQIIGMVGLYILSTAVIIVSIMLVINTPLSQFMDKLKEKRALRKHERDWIEQLESQTEPQPEGEIKEKKTGRNTKTNSHSAITEDSLYTPVGTAISRGQMKILDYMNDDDLFERETPKAKDGIPEIITSASEMDPDLPTEEKKTVAAQVIPNPEHVEAISDVKKMTNRDASKAVLAPEELNLVPPVTSPNVVFKLPPIELLKKNTIGVKAGEEETLQAKAAKLEKTLQDFNVNAKVTKVTKGPAVTRYEIQPSTGVKVSSIVRLSDDIALNLEAKSIRIEAPIPGKAAVGIEVENEKVNLVSIREIIDSKEFKNAKSKITFSVGKDISGNSIVADLKGMPHLLIAGSTGSGKSVCINSIIVSLLYKANPDEVKLVLVDPKVVELGSYNGIPHLLIPVVTDPSKAAAALNWAVAEMTDRYKKFAEESVRDLESFNHAVKEKNENDRYLPQIVIIIDELADLMMAAPSQVEESICRLAQMARAAGMHLIVATQRPSVDIITGVIKANIPSRIAFAVSSQFDSRTILDMGGAEKLVGKGDMLFNPLGMAKPIRVQGNFISDQEVNAVIDYVKSQGVEHTYSNDVIHTIEKVQSPNSNEDEDELLPDAIEVVVKAKQASVSMLQRRFRVGYNRAARLVDMMESRGIIGPADGSRPRQVFLTEEELYALDEEVSAEEPPLS